MEHQPPQSDSKLSGEPPLEKIEKYIPLRHSDLVKRLKESLTCHDSEAKSYGELCDQLTAIFHVEHLMSLMKVEDIYSPLDPDADFMESVEISGEERSSKSEQLFDRMTQILHSAHYHKLSREELERAINSGYRWGVKLDVDFDVFDRLEIFARGVKPTVKKRRRWQNFFREEQTEIPEFHRLVMMFRLNPSSRLKGEMDSDVVYLKMFKNIPESELEILLPGSKVKLTILDQGKILIPNISSAALTVYKVFRLTILLTLFAAVWFILKWVIAIAVLAGYFTKAIFSYFNTKDKYQFGLTRSLYLKNLDNNVGVIYRLYNEAEEQEMCETVLAYSMIRKHCQGAGLPESEIESKAEGYLKSVVDFEVEFEIHDALGKLARLGLAEIDQQGRWKATPLDEAIKRLKLNWQKILQIGASESGELFTSS